jgi:predicted house-cleaning noncanonical NTP pyrophosphatase (MazG superfamily)
MAKLPKLVRDNIPDIIRADNREPVTRILSEDEYVGELEKKLQEEVTEYIIDKNIEELADILEVVYALASTLDATPEEVEMVRLNKKQKNGAFNNRILLDKIK